MHAWPQNVLSERRRPIVFDQGCISRELTNYSSHSHQETAHMLGGNDSSYFHAQYLARHDNSAQAWQFKVGVLKNDDDDDNDDTTTTTTARTLHWYRSWTGICLPIEYPGRWQNEITDVVDSLASVCWWTTILCPACGWSCMPLLLFWHTRQCSCQGSWKYSGGFSTYEYWLCCQYRCRYYL